ncbi:MAG: UPF0262 family protein [Ilumatobacteraceae bacterium]
MSSAPNHRLSRVTIDEASLAAGSPEQEHERKVAIFDLLESNAFCPDGADDGPFELALSLAENRLCMDIKGPVYERRHLLSLSPFRGIIKDYFIVCESYYDAIRSATAAHIEALDMGRRGLHDDGSISFYATYTAFDGTHISQQLLHTKDFATFTSSGMAGSAAVGKGLALFPRMIHGRYAALSRSDRESNSIAFSDDIRCWPTSQVIQTPEQSWEILQLGNCGSPIETDRGWLVLTHGVGPMRTYSISAILLDLDEPQYVLARSPQPIISAGADRRDGYVPNVVYTCGAVARHDTLVVPYGVADQTIAVATLSITELLDAMTPEPRRT